MASDELAGLINSTSRNLGINPVDLATAMSYETGGTFNPNLWGGKNNNYMGLIQFGPEERDKYGVSEGMPLQAHMGAVENFLRDRGVKPGMGLLDIYSTINAGSPGRYNASDANNGGAPGTVADKVATQMAAHRMKAAGLLGVDPQSGATVLTPPQATPPVQTAQPQGAPMQLAPAAPQQQAQQSPNGQALAAQAMKLLTDNDIKINGMQFATPPGIAQQRAKIRGMLS